jgi:hypothetical protein
MQITNQQLINTLVVILLGLIIAILLKKVKYKKRLLFNRRTKIEVKFIVVWYDLWVGIYYDRDFSTAYILILPCMGFTIQRYNRIIEVDFSKVEDEILNDLYGKTDKLDNT